MSRIMHPEGCLMMSNNVGCRGFLLRTSGDISDFERRMGDSLQEKSDKCLEWLRGFPVMRWVDPLRGVYESEVAREVIQTICYLYIRKRIRISFDESMRVRVEPDDPEAWVRDNFSTKGKFLKSEDYL